MSKDSKGPRSRGRPRLDIANDDIAEVVAELLDEGGIDAVSILDAADKLNVSRATLYRTVPTKEDLLGILFERSTAELTQVARRVVATTPDPAERLTELVRMQVIAAVRMRAYLPVYFGGGKLPPEVFDRWHAWSREYESMWVEAVRTCMDEGVLPEGNAVITARLLLGSCLWVARWYRPQEKFSATDIAETAAGIVGALQTGKPTPGHEGAERQVG